MIHTTFMSLPALLTTLNRENINRTPIYVPMNRYAVTTTTPLYTYGYGPCLAFILIGEIYDRNIPIGIMGHVPAGGITGLEQQIVDYDAVLLKFIQNLFQKLSPYNVIVKEIYFIDGVEFLKSSSAISEFETKLAQSRSVKLSIGSIYRLYQNNRVPMGNNVVTIDAISSTPGSVGQIPRGGIVYDPVLQELFVTSDEGLVSLSRATANIYGQPVRFYFTRDHTLEKITHTRWLPEAEVKICFSCRTSVSFFSGKHHCRCCGQVFCTSCSSRLINMGPNFPFCRDCPQNKRDPYFICHSCRLFYLDTPRSFPSAFFGLRVPGFINTYFQDT